MDQSQQNLLYNLQAVSFVLVDLQLYLDTHPEDTKTLQDYAAYAQRQRMLHRAYEERFGPLHDYGCARSNHIDAWVEEPWPWQM